MKKNEKHIKGLKRNLFTLTEMVVAIAIIIIITGVAIPGIIAIMNRAKKAKAKSQIANFDTAIINFQSDIGRFPSSLDELVKTTGDKKWDGPYLGNTTVVPKDPWNSDYIYQYPSSHGADSYEIKSLGKDKAPGGTGSSADISNWTTE